MGRLYGYNGSYNNIRQTLLSEKSVLYPTCLSEQMFSSKINTEDNRNQLIPCWAEKRYQLNHTANERVGDQSLRVCLGMLDAADVEVFAEFAGVATLLEQEVIFAALSEQ
ncbi:hypothetical protein SCG7086_AR_00080 [Chlamydiales bacterium SCGC AG-110-P3]|nr:hypothetical protein SCG7086_AR_00080 [Chlamydiales bacterium SCGC AG-110-P3]